MYETIEDITRVPAGYLKEANTQLGKLRDLQRRVGFAIVDLKRSAISMLPIEVQDMEVEDLWAMSFILPELIKMKVAERSTRR
jgi:hypothetical protein